MPFEPGKSWNKRLPRILDLIDTPRKYGAAAQILQLDATGRKLEWVTNIEMATASVQLWAAGVRTAGTYVFDVDNYAAVPSGVRAVFVAAGTSGATSSSDNYVLVCPYGSTSGPVIVRCITNYWNDATGWVAVDSSGRFQVIIAGADQTCYLDIWGWAK